MGFRAYFKNIYAMSKTIVTGMRVTMSYFLNCRKTCSTLQYPHELDTLPERHRGIHYLETAKCTMCTMCAKTCPVNCIQIEGTRDGELPYGFKAKGITLSRFSVDYGRCLFCNLCVEVCPSSCIHMQPVAQRPYIEEFDFANTNRRAMIKNLLTDKIYSNEDHHCVKLNRLEIKRLAEEKKRSKAERQ